MQVPAVHTTIEYNPPERTTVIIILAVAFLAGHGAVSLYLWAWNK